MRMGQAFILMSPTMMHRGLLSVGLILLFHLAFLGSDKVQSFGGIVQITCKYNVHKYTYSMCWGRGHCPSSGCNDGIIWTDGNTVTWRKSDKYRLTGDIELGDVTLTITGATIEDTGTYCCRVEVPGLFNDLKKEMNVNKEHVEDDYDDAINDPRVALVYVPKEFPLPYPKVTQKETEKVSEQEISSPTEPEGTVRELLLITEMTEKSYIPTIIRLTVICSLTFLPLLIYSCIMKMNKDKT